MSTTIQFTQLADLLAELPNNHIIRIEVLDTTQEILESSVGLRLALIGVHCRALDPTGNILSCAIPVKQLHIPGPHPGPELGHIYTRYQQAIANGETLKQRLTAHLQQQGFQPRPGVIDMNGAGLILGHWTPPNQ